MNSVIKLHVKVLDEIITHCNIDKHLECGGYLYGNYKKSFDNQIITINGIYYEKVFGTENGFNFSPMYKLRAKTREKEIFRQYGSRLIGCYHSHAEYKAKFSDVDRKLEMLHYSSNKSALIYSPIDEELIGDIITFNAIHEARITLINQDEVERLYFPKIPIKPGKVLALKK